MWPGATDEESNRTAVQERKNAKSKVRIYETFPIRNFDHWIIERELKLANRNVKTESWNPETGN